MQPLCISSKDRVETVRKKSRLIPPCSQSLIFYSSADTLHSSAAEYEVHTTAGCLRISPDTIHTNMDTARQTVSSMACPATSKIFVARLTSLQLLILTQQRRSKVKQLCMLSNKSMTSSPPGGYTALYYKIEEKLD